MNSGNQEAALGTSGGLAALHNLTASWKRGYHEKFFRKVDKFGGAKDKYRIWMFDMLVAIEPFQRAYVPLRVNPLRGAV